MPKRCRKLQEEEAGRVAAGFRNAFAILVVGFAVLSGVATATAEGPTQLDLNRASAAELEALPGIGAVKAAAILAVREERGGFKQVAEIESVRGIGPALTAKLRPLVVVRQSEAPKMPNKREKTRTAKK